MATYTKTPNARDTYIYSFQPDTAHNGDLFIINSWSDRIARSLLNFDLSDFGGGTISSAKLKLKYYNYAAGDPVGKVVYAYKATRDAWTVNATWNKYDGSADWTAPGGDFSLTNGVGVAMPAGYGVMEWDIKDIVIDAVANEGKKLNVLLKYQTEADGSSYQAAFRGGLYVTEGDRPILEVTYVPAYTLTAETGVFNLSGQTVAFPAAFRMAIEAGAFNLTGQDATLTKVGKITNQTKNNAVITNQAKS